MSFQFSAEFNLVERSLARGKALKKVTYMKRILCALALIGMATLGWADDTKQSDTERLQLAATVLHQVMAAPDKGIPDKVLEHAKCIAVVPHMVKGGFIFGAEGGKGVATCRTEHGWSAPAFFIVAGGSWGLQIGVEGVDLIMVVQNEKGMEHMLSSKFKIGADASAAAGPIGRSASADTDWKMDAEILTYSRAKGVFAGLTLSGADVSQDHDAMLAMYGPDVTYRSVLSGTVPPPAGSHAFLDAVRNAKSDSSVARGSR
jgi:SH3 domain-containing YSC84-like protein 1